VKAKYYLQGDEFVIENYNNAKPFASFLPGIAGLYGKPLWAFYVNRGQCMASFGTSSKEGAIMEFYPANTAYRRTSLESFRTFIKIRSRKSKVPVYEPFKIHEDGDEDAPLQKLFISPHEFRIEEIDKKRSIKCEVIYYTIPGEDFPALARVLKVTNLSSRSIGMEILDGMPKLEPYGMNDWFMKNMSRTIEAWMEVLGLDQGTPFYRLRTDAADVSEIRHIKSGNFYLSAIDGKKAKVRYVADPRVVFGDVCDLSRPARFESPNFAVPKCQIDKNITPSAFSHSSVRLGGKKTVSVCTLIGHAESFPEAKRIRRKMSGAFFNSKRILNREETEKIASSVRVFSGIPEFDLYVRQTNLDNIMRGGYPVSIGTGGKKKVIYAFNRKHGDLERDYNNFVLRPEFYSQGNGNFRDTNQNRRLSVWLNPETGRKDIKDFYDLIQLDGYNPLVIKGDIFTIAARKGERIVRKYIAAWNRPEAKKFLSGAFTPGSLIKFLSGIGNGVQAQSAFKEVIAASEATVDAEHGEGYWIDHWTYNLDLVESYLGLFPEKRDELLFGNGDYMFFDDAHRVKTRKERYTLDSRNRLRQYHSVFFDKEKKALIDSRKKLPSWVRTKNGKGDIYKCTLAAKMISMIANKIATLDTRGIGVEMEANKPAWCDPLNGLPGVRGSSVSETMELARMVAFLSNALAGAACASVRVPAEIASFVSGLAKELSSNIKGSSGDYSYWDKSNALKEAYRASVRFGLSGKETGIGREELVRFLSLSKRKLERGIKKAYGPEGVPSTYFMNDDRPKALPLSLEGPVHALKIERDVKKARLLYDAVRKSALYDKALGMYKVNVSMAKEPLEIGRIRAFVPGWLENESIWLHMEYKFMLELLKHGLYGEFYADLKKAAIPFLDPARYGRSILENSSFITPSGFFDKDLRGNGFVARLSGSTAELLEMLLIMNLGHKPFSVEDGALVFRPRPALHKMFFSEVQRAAQVRVNDRKKNITIPDSSYAFNLFGNTLVTYRNPKMLNTFGSLGVKPLKFNIKYKNGEKRTIDGAVLGEPFSAQLRGGSIESLDILLG
jgi:hypothetical protein